MRRLAYSILFLTSPLLAETTSSAKDPSVAFAEIDAQYQAGEYKNFLEALHTKYLNDREQGKLQEFIQEVKADYKDPKGLAKQVETLDQERNGKLREILKQNPDAPISIVITQLFSSDTCSKDEKEVWDYLNNLEKGSFANSTDPFEKSLQEVQEEFALKKLMLQSSYLSGEKSKEAVMNQHVILEEEKLQKILALCQGSTNPMAKKIVASSSDVFPKYVKAKISTMYIFSLIQGEVAPRDEVEKKVKDILVEYRDKKRQLMTTAQ